MIRFKQARKSLRFLNSQIHRHPDRWINPGAHIPFQSKHFNHEARTPQQERDLRTYCHRSRDPETRALFPNYPGFRREA